MLLDTHQSLVLPGLKCFFSFLDFIFAWLTCVGSEWLFDVWSWFMGRDCSNREQFSREASLTHTGHIITLKQTETEGTWVGSCRVTLLRFAWLLTSLFFPFLPLIALLFFFLPGGGMLGSGRVWDCLETLLLFIGTGCWLLQRLWIWLRVAKHGVNARRQGIASVVSQNPRIAWRVLVGGGKAVCKKNSFFSKGVGVFQLRFWFLESSSVMGRLLVLNQCKCLMCTGRGLLVSSSL